MELWCSQLSHNYSAAMSSPIVIELLKSVNKAPSQDDFVDFLESSHGRNLILNILKKGVKVREKLILCLFY